MVNKKMQDRELSPKEEEALRQAQASMKLSGMEPTREEMEEVKRLLKADLNEEEFHSYLESRIEELKNKKEK